MTIPTITYVDYPELNLSGFESFSELGAGYDINEDGEWINTDDILY